MNELTLKLLTDSDILEYSDDRILTSEGDFNLKGRGKNNWNRTIRGGVYDIKLFGSPYSNKCLCGKTRIIGVECGVCRAKILPINEMYRQRARIEFDVYYCNFLRFKNGLKPFIYSLFDAVYLVSGEAKTRVSQGNLTQEYVDIYQMEYDEKLNALLINQDITDVNKTSYEGLLLIIKDFYPDKEIEYLDYLNKYYLVIPPVMRMFNYIIINGSKRLKIPVVTAAYQAMVHMKYYCRDQELATPYQEEKAVIRGILRAFINNSISIVSEVLGSSKENVIRTSIGKRSVNSGRATIVADPTLKIDEIRLPIHLAYEAFKDEFIKFLMHKYDYTELQAETEVNKGDKDEKIIKEFEDWSEGKMVMIMRQPVLHEYSVLAMNLKLTREYCIGYPLMVTGPLNADFDGDTISFFVIPDDLREQASKMSPKNQIIYKKNLKPIFMPSHEVLQGLQIASKVVLKDDMPSFNTKQEAMDAGLDEKEGFYFDKSVTSIYRIELEEMLEMKLDDIIGVGKEISSTNIVDVISALNYREDRKDVLKKLQDFGNLVITIEGIDVIPYENLYNDLPKDIFDKVKQIQDTNQSDEVKAIQISNLYQTYISNVSKNLPEGIKKSLESSNRTKLTSFLAIMTPQLYIDGDSRTHLTKNSLAEGLDPEDYVQHAIQNRWMQDNKKSGVPQAGYFTRQSIYTSALEYEYDENNLDPDNFGLEMTMKEAVGRTTLDGRVITPNNSNEIVKVRSILTTSLIKTITPDMLNEKLRQKGTGNIGIGFLMSTTENLTQSSLGLKHGGVGQEIDSTYSLTAPEDCEVILDKDWIYLKYDNQEFKYPKSDTFVLSRSTNLFSKGEKIGYSYKLNNPIYNLDSLIKLLAAASVPKKKSHEKNRVDITDCYALADGHITYKSKTEAVIGGIVHNINSKVQAYFPEGAKIEKYQRITSGLINLNKVFQHLDLIDGYYLFKIQFKEYNKTLTNELIELCYRVITKVDENEKVKLVGIRNAVKDITSSLTRMSKERAKDYIQKIASSESNEVITNDTLSNLILSTYVLNNADRSNFSVKSQS